MKPKVLVLIHGFLGSADDWNFLTKSSSFKDWIIIKPDLFSKNSNQNLFVPLTEWGNNFWIFIIEKLKLITNNKNSNLENFDFYLCGYSLGGRLLLHAFHSKPAVIQKAVFISASYGFFKDNNCNSQMRTQRRQLDAIWSDQFSACKSQNDFDVIIDRWNNQDVFLGENLNPVVSFKKEFAKYDMSLLAFALTQWGQAEQKFYLNEDIDWIKTYWLYGEYDHKYEKLYSDLASKISMEKICLIEKAAHRVIFDNPVKVRQKLEEIFSNT